MVYDVSTKVDERDMGNTVGALGNSPLRIVRDCKTTKAMWDKLNLRYASKTMTNKLGLVQTFFSLQMNKEDLMGDRISYLESQFMRLQMMGTDLEESLRVSMLMNSLSHLK